MFKIIVKQYNEVIFQTFDDKSWRQSKKPSREKTL